MLIRVFDRHAQSLSRQIAKARHPLPSRRRLRPWVKRLRDLILFPFYTAAWAHGRGKTVSHSSSRTQIKAMDKAVEL